MPDAVLLLAGRDGTRSEALRTMVDESRLHANVRFLGVRDDVPDLLCAADAFALPSRREGLPGALLEAMALEVPIVATDIPTILDAVPGSEYAELVTMDDQVTLATALLNTLSDRPGAAARAERSRARFDERFAVSQVASQMCSFYAGATS